MPYFLFLIICLYSDSFNNLIKWRGFDEERGDKEFFVFEKVGGWHTTNHNAKQLTTLIFQFLCQDRFQFHQNQNKKQNVIFQILSKLQTFPFYQTYVIKTILFIIMLLDTLIITHSFVTLSNTQPFFSFWIICSAFLFSPLFVISDKNIYSSNTFSQVHHKFNPLSEIINGRSSSSPMSEDAFPSLKYRW